MLTALWNKLLAKAKQDNPDVPVGTLTRDEAYTQLHYGEIDGIPGTATIDRTGEMIGFSPVERCKVNGELRWIPLDLVKNLRTEPFLFVESPPYTSTAPQSSR